VIKNCAKKFSQYIRVKRRRVSITHLLLFPAIGMQPLAVYAKEQRIQNVIGYGEDENLAIRQALRDAVARACGERISSTLDLNSLSSNSKSLSNNGRDDRSFSSSSETSSNISTTTDGIVSRYDVIKSQRDEAGNRHAVTLNVVVGRCLVEVDVNSLNNQMAQVLSEIVKVGQTGGLISDPNTYAEFYHNARFLQQRGEIDLAMQAYEQALSEGYLFVDPLLDLLDLANARYGEDGTKIYFEDRIKNRIPKQLSDIGELALNGDYVKLIQPILDDEVTFSPLLAIWLTSSLYEQEMDTLAAGRSRAKAAGLISGDYRSGRFQGFFIDKVRGAALGQKTIREWNLVVSHGTMVDRYTISRASVQFYGPFSIKSITIQDRVDSTQPITLCASVYGGQLTCKNLDPSENLYDGWPHYYGTHPNGTSMLNWTHGMHCAVSVSYTDLLGFKVTSPVLVNDFTHYGVGNQDADKIIQCAGKYYRP
jgi:hypothetical protein